VYIWNAYCFSATSTVCDIFHLILLNVDRCLHDLAPWTVIYNHRRHHIVRRTWTQVISWHRHIHRMVIAGNRSFPVAGPRPRTNLSETVRSSSSLPPFKRQLKTVSCFRCHTDNYTYVIPKTYILEDLEVVFHFNLWQLHTSDLQETPYTKDSAHNATISSWICFTKTDDLYLVFLIIPDVGKSGRIHAYKSTKEFQIY